MQDESHPIEAKRVRQEMQRLLDEVPVKTAVAIGVANLFKGNAKLEHPRWFIEAGRIIHEPPPYVRHEMSGVSVFGKTEYSMRGTSGLVSYDISGTELMCVVQFMMPFSETLFENRYFVGIMKQQELDESLYYELNQRSKKPDEEIAQEEHGYKITGTMTKAAKAIIMLECFDNKDVAAAPGTTEKMATEEEEKPQKAQQLQAGPQLQEKLHAWIKESDVKCCCAVGVNNFTNDPLTDPEIYVDTGRCIFEPPERTDPNMAAPALFAKTQFSLRGSAGVFVYTIGSYKIAVMWTVPLSETLHNNVFNIRILPTSAKCDHDLFRNMREGGHQAKDGELNRREEGGYEIEGSMETDSRCALIVNLHHRGKK